MTLSSLRAMCASLPVRSSLSVAAVAGVLISGLPQLFSQETEVRSVAPTRLVRPIDDRATVTLKNNVRRDVAHAPDLGPVEDSREMHLYLVLQRTAEQQGDLENLIQRQQQPGAAEYHKWLTPKSFGARFGASPEDIGKLSQWLESHGFQVRSVLNNASLIDFAATAGQVREAFHTQLHYVELRGGKLPALLQDPQIPAALAPVVAGIKGLNRIPALMNHTPPRAGTFDEATHHWKPTDSTTQEKALPDYTTGAPYYYVTPQDLYTIYNVNPVFTGGHLGATATVAVIEESDIEYGTVNATSHVATGGDVATFRTLFGVPGTLNLHVYHGYGSVTCSDPGIDPNDIGEDLEASLDAEWINSTAPSANQIFMSCDSTTDNGIFSSEAALIDNNLSDVMSLSYGDSELNFTSASDYSSQDTLYAQAATQGQSIFVSSGDAGSDAKDQNSEKAAVSGMNVNALASSPLVTSTGGTDFSDRFDSGMGGPAQSTYWSSTNTSKYGDALSYVPETAWNNTCASSLIAAVFGDTSAEYCASETADEDGFLQVVGSGGGISTHYAVPAWQTGISGYSNSMHALPDISGFASAAPWYHALIFCDSHRSSYSCATTSTFGVDGGTSFVAPYMAGVAGLLVNYTGERQGLLNPGLYALAKAQYTGSATETACYANGQTANAGVTTGLPAASCIFNDVTTSNNDVACAAGTLNCYYDRGSSYGLLSTTGSSSLTVAYPATIGFDQATGIGSVNVSNLITKWNTAFTSATALSASPTSIASTASTTLKATVTTGTPTGYVDTKPATTGTATFKSATATLGSCTLSGGTCSIAVQGTALASGTNSITATYAGSGTYPSSTSSAVAVTVTSGGGPAVSLSATTIAFGTEPVGSTTASQTVTLTNTGSATLTISSILLGGANPSDYAFSNSCGTSLAAGANCTIHGHFAPTTSGSLPATITITDNAGGSPQTIALTGTGGGAPAVSLSTTTIAFGSEPVGATTASQTVTLTNTGSGTLTISSIVLGGANPSSYAFSNTCGTSLTAGANCTIHGHFSPTKSGSLPATITITDNAAGSPQAIALSGTGGGSPTVSLSATTVAFGNETVGATTASQTVTLTNTGSSSLTISGIVLGGANPSSYAFSNSCGTSLAAGANCTIHGHFSPTTTGSLPATINITDNASGSPQTIALTGTGGSPAVSLSAATIAFGSEAVGATTASQTVTLTNTGSITLTISSIVLGGANPSSYAFSNSCGSSVAAGASCTIHGHFSPTTTGSLPATITITDNAGGSPQTIALTGTGD